MQAPPRPGVPETNYVEIAGPPTPEIDVVDIPVPPRLWRLSFPKDKLVKKGLVSLATWLSLRALAARYAIDVVLLYNVPQVVLAGAVPATVVVDVADDLLAMLDHEAGPLARRVVVPLAGRALRRLVTAADLVTTPSTVLAERLGAKARVLPNGADLREAALADGSGVRRSYSPPILGFVGAFEYFVDFDLVLDVAARLPSCTFLLVGGGRDLPKVRAQVARRGLSNVQFTGPVAYREALNYMAAFDIALIPFRAGPVADGACPLKLFEYVALKRPVVSRPTAEMLRIAADWVAFGATVDEWVEIVRSLLGSPREALTLVQRGYEALESTYRWDRIAVEFERLIESARERDSTGRLAALSGR
jgi:glycosyltransferase involved in cell wall biosynthesis